MTSSSRSSPRSRCAMFFVLSVGFTHSLLSNQIGKDGQVSYRQVAHEDDDAGNLIDNLDDDYDDDAVEKA